MQVLDPEAIRAGRIMRGWSQADLGTLCRVSQQAVAKLEAGDLRSIRPEFAAALTRNLRLDAEVVFLEPGAISVPATRSSEDGTAKAAS